MLIISAGMQKAGTGYIYNVINDLLIASGYTDARDIKSENNMENIMRWHNNNVYLNFYNLVRLCFLSRKVGPFVIKTHNSPSLLMRFLLMRKQIKVIYIFRDPRDVLLSAADHGKRLLESGEKHNFAQMVDFEAALKIVKKWCRICIRYKNMDGVLSLKYEDLMHAPKQVVSDIVHYLGLSVDDETVSSILDKYSRDSVTDEKLKGALHLNKAETGRYKTEMKADQIERIQKELGSFFQETGYTLEQLPGSD